MRNAILFVLAMALLGAILLWGFVHFDVQATP